MKAYYGFLEKATLDCEDHSHFYAVASQTMRRVLVDHARKRRTAKRAGSCLPMSALKAFTYLPRESCQNMIALDEALTRLAEWDERLCRVIELRFFAGFGEESGSGSRNWVRTVKRDWVAARAWLNGSWAIRILVSLQAPYDSGENGGARAIYLKSPSRCRSRNAADFPKEAARDSELRVTVLEMLDGHRDSGAVDRFVVRMSGIFPKDIKTSVFSAGEVLARRFEIVRFLGRGGMGEVYEAVDQGNCGKVALKLFARNWPSMQACSKGSSGK